jgi:2-polyprenyl-3-methyl-5-hydroxy-6-metoxy-1,4-benzoquinol methylase
MPVKQAIKRVYDLATHGIGRLTKRYYFEDYIRVYPQQQFYNRWGIKRAATAIEIKNYLNHCKFYRFAAQFVRDHDVVDVGCGSGYGCEILAQSGARSVHGCDISRHALNFARKTYGHHAKFSEQGITDLKEYANAAFDVTICSEVLEHIKEYHLEAQAVQELKRVTKTNGIIIIGTPNSELLNDHGFSFEEIHTLMTANFTTFCIIENALIPFGTSERVWKQRKLAGRTGLIVSQAINLEETVIPDGEVARIKSGDAPGNYLSGDLNINTTLLHNTHSWIIVAVN